MKTRTSRRVGSLIERRRECSDRCGHRDVAIVRPAEILNVFLCTQQLPDREPEEIA